MTSLPQNCSLSPHTCISHSFSCLIFSLAPSPLILYVFYLLFMYIICPPTLECTSKAGERFGLFCSLLCLWHLDQCLAHSNHPTVFAKRVDNERIWCLLYSCHLTLVLLPAYTDVHQVMGCLSLSPSRRFPDMYKRWSHKALRPALLGKEEAKP